MKRITIFAPVALAVGMLSAGNPISNVTLVQRNDGNVVVGYTLSRDSIVTVDFVQNGRSIGVENFTDLTGDANRFAAAGARSFTWNPKHVPLADEQMVLKGVKPVLTAWDPASPPDYMVVDLMKTAVSKYDNRTYYRSAEYVPGGVTNNADYKSTRLVMRRIPAAGVEWLMGMATNDACYSAANECRRRVILSKDYYMGVFEITQLMAKNAFNLSEEEKTYPAGAERDGAPRNSMRWIDVRGASDGTTTPAAPSENSYLGILRARTLVDFDLPTSAQWEFACRGGTKGQTYVTDADDFTYATTLENSHIVQDAATRARLDAISWNYWNSTAANAAGDQILRAHVVGCKAPNAYGLYDMLGNVWEMCLDYWVSGDALRTSFGGRGFAEPIVDPCVLTKVSSSDRVRRGCSATESAVIYAMRAGHGLSVPETSYWCGLRLVCPLN